MTTIRRAVHTDVPQLVQNRWDMQVEDGYAGERVRFEGAATRFISGALDDEDWAIWVAEDGGQILANIFVRVQRGVPRPDRLIRRWGWMTNMYARPRGRNAGVGSALLGSVIAWARAEGLGLLTVWPSDRSVPFYERNGFRRSPDLLELHLIDDD